MNYEHSALSEIESKLNELNTLLGDVKDNFTETKANELLKNSFNELSLIQENKINELSQNNLSILGAKIENDLSLRVAQLFNDNKQELLSLVLKGLNLDNLSQEIARDFLAQNKECFNEIARDFLESENLESFIQENKENITQELREFKNEKERQEVILKSFIDTLSVDVKRAVEIKANDALKTYIDENKQEVFKPFSLHFLKDIFLKDGFFVDSVKAEAKRAAKEQIKYDFLENVENALLDINKDLAKDFFNSKYINEKAFLQTLTLTAMNLNNELKHISYMLNYLRDFENGIDITDKKIFKVV